MPPPTEQDQPYDFAAAAERLRRRGVMLRKHPGFYSVNLRNHGSATEYRTEELADAFRHGMTLEAKPELPPLGPIGTGNTYRARMYRHNRRLSAKRARAAALIGRPEH